MTRDARIEGRRQTLIRALVLVVPPTLGLAGILAIVVLQPGYPRDVAIGVALFLVVWFWFRALGRHLGAD